MLLLLENAPLREAVDLVSQPWFKLYHFLSTWRSDIDMGAWSHTTKCLAAHPQGFQRQLDAIAALRPEHVPPTHWSMLVEDRLRQSVRSGYQWEELLSSWVALYCQIAQHVHAAAAPGATATTAEQQRHAAPGAATEGADMRVQGRPSTTDGSLDAAVEVVGGTPGGGQLPEFDAFLLHMFALEADPQAQLDYVAEFKPAAMSQANWDTEIGKVRPRQHQQQASMSQQDADHTCTTLSVCLQIYLHSECSTLGNKHSSAHVVACCCCCCDHAAACSGVLPEGHQQQLPACACAAANHNPAAVPRCSPQEHA